jgi:acetoacetate decarboxylase
MKVEEILRAPSIPIASPSYPAGPFRFINREYLVISYESDPEAIRSALPEPLAPDGSNLVSYEFIRMPDSSGFGDYSESGVVIPAKYKEESVNFVAQMYLDNLPAIVGGREIWGFPKKLATPRLKAISDTLTGVLEYGNVQVAIGTMTYKHLNLERSTGNPDGISSKEIIGQISKTQVTLKVIPHCDGSPAIAQLISFNISDIVLKGAWSGSAGLCLFPHANAPVADLPVRKVVKGTHYIADLTLPYGKVMHDYLSPGPA